MRLIGKVIEGLGELAIFFSRSIASFREIRRLPEPFSGQVAHLGVGSLPIVIITSAFVGMVTAVQLAYQIRDYAPIDFLGAGVAKMILIELGPVLTALVVAGRVGAGIAAELGTMKVTEQIDALECMAIDPYYFIVLPRILAGIMIVPILTIFSEFTAIVSGGFVSNAVVHLPYSVYFSGMKLYFSPRDLFGGLLKALIFGLVITMMGCYYGFRTSGGAVGVGKSTTKAVVASSLLILILDYLVGVIIYG